MDECELLDLECKAKEWAASTIGDAITKMADAVLEARQGAQGSAAQEPAEEETAAAE